MKRRDILRYTAYVTGVAVSAPLMSTIMSGCKSDNATSVADGLKFFTKEEFALVKELINTILPKTDSPSATEVGVHDIIDNMVGLVYPEASKEAYKKGFGALASYMDTGSDTLSSLKKIEAGEAEETVRKAYLDLKQQTVAYYLSTEEVATNFLNYLPVPGEYKSCISLEEVDGKAWAI